MGVLILRFKNIPSMHFLKINLVMLIPIFQSESNKLGYFFINIIISPNFKT